MEVKKTFETTAIRDFMLLGYCRISEGDELYVLSITPNILNVTKKLSSGNKTLFIDPRLYVNAYVNASSQMDTVEKLIDFIKNTNK